MIGWTFDPYDLIVVGVTLAILVLGLAMCIVWYLSKLHAKVDRLLIMLGDEEEEDEAYRPRHI